MRCTHFHVIRLLRRLLVRTLLALGLVSALLMPATATYASSPFLPIGTWGIEANGKLGTLEITTVDIVGNLTGTLFGAPINGFWDGYANRITFETKKASVDLQVYTGYVVRTEPSALLAGSFETLSTTSATATRSVFGWQAEAFGSSQYGSLVSSEAPYAAPFPATFTIVANGQPGTLAISLIDAQNRVSGMLEGKAIQGLWNLFQRKLTFIWYGNFADASQLKVYTGYLIGSSTCKVEANCRFAGTFEAFSGSGGVAQRNVFGWHATFAKTL